MRRVKYAGCMSAALLIAGCSNGPDTSKVADEVSGAMTETVAAINARDAEKAVAIDTPGFVGIFHGMDNVNGKAADLALTKLQLGDPALKFDVSTPEVNVSAGGDMAVWRANYVYTFTDPKAKAPTTERGNWIVVFRRQSDGTMKKSLGVMSDVAAAPAAAPV
jgi:ketosteroid isomerase-like protein